MKASALEPGEVTESTAAGRVLCHDVVAAGEFGRVRLSKGRVLTVEDIAALRAYPGEIHLIEMEPGDIHEDEASVRLARAIAGSGLEAKGPIESQTLLRAVHRGIVEIKVAALAAMDGLTDVSVYTVFDGQPVDVGKAVAATKVTPLTVPEAIVERAETIAREAYPVVQIRPFEGRSVGVIVRDRLQSKARSTFEAALALKLGWFGSPVAAIRYLPDDLEAIVHAIEDFIADGVGLLLAAGVNSTDPLDLTIRAVERAGARSERRGVPAHPGSTCWLAYLGDVPVFGLALCGMFSQTTALDLLLPRFLSGQHVGAEDIAALGHGGMLSKEMAFRFPTYEVA